MDLSPLDKYIQCDNFQMLTISQMRTLLPRGAVTISIDLTDAYWQVPGICINKKKSRLNPQSSFQWLGLEWGLNKQSLSILSAKHREIAKQVRLSIRRKIISQERILGLLQFASVVDPILKARLKDINRVWQSRVTSRLRDHRSVMPQLLKKQLRPWTKASSLAKVVPLQPPPPSIFIHTDASLQGWGAHSQKVTVQGQWSKKFRCFHINVLEAMAVLLALKRLKTPRKSHIRLILDNAVVVHSINRKGSKSPSVNHVVIAIILLARKKGWHLSAIHLEGVRNVVADSLSRSKPLETEWKLDHNSFQWIYQKVPSLEIDPFATFQNHKLPLYVSPNHDPQAVAMDALSLDWNQWESIYVFPPFNLLMKVLDKLRLYKGRVALVAPQWPKSNWYPLLMELRLKPWSIPNPVLSQMVQTKTLFASS